jgi:AcrR family transcriptional regulator
MAEPGKPKMRLREQNKQRTRETIVQVAVELFVERGYRATTLVEIAAAAGVAPSTLHAYFQLKEDLLFSVYDVVLESAKQHLLDESCPQSGIDALSAWVGDELPAVLTRYGTDHLVHTYETTRSDPELLSQERSRDAILEDIFAAAFARDFEPSEVLRPKVAATIALHAIKEVWYVWTREHATDNQVALAELTSQTTDHVRSVLEASKKAIDALPRPAAIDVGARRPKRTSARTRAAETRRPLPSEG